MKRLRRKHNQHRGRLVVALALVMAMAFLAGVWMLFQWRFSLGDVYPPGSSMRSDPLGSRAFFEALQELPGTEVSRNTEPYRKMTGGGEGKSLFLLGVSRTFLERDRSLAEVEALSEFVSSGGRLVLTVNPARQATWDYEEEEEGEKEGEEKVEGAGKEEGAEKEEGEARTEEEKRESSIREEQSGEELFDSFATKWEFELDWIEEPRPEKGWKARAAGDFEELDEEQLPRWYSALFFEDDGDEEAWEVLARVKRKAVLVRRSLEKGEIILATDSYFTSNEALLRSRFPEFLLWLTGGNDVIIFDEAHHGTVLQENIMQMARRFRLHGFFVGLGLFVVLLAWRSGSSLLPGDEEIGLGISLRHEVSGQEAAAGFRKLLRRSVRVRELLETSFETWRHRKSRLSRAYSDDQIRAAQQVIAREKAKPGGKADPVTAYREIVKILGERS